MSERVLSVVLLPTAECNASCDYCFEHKPHHRLPSLFVPLLTRSLLDHMQREGIGECEIYWQGGEPLLMGPDWYSAAAEMMGWAAEGRGFRFSHFLQTNLIGYSPAWNPVIRGMFRGSLGTSMDYPNVHRRLAKGGTAGFTERWTQRLHQARAAGIEVGVIAVVHQATLDAGPEAFYHYFTQELGLRNLQVNTPFPGGPARDEPAIALDPQELTEFLTGLFTLWMESGFDSGVTLGPFDALIDHFTGHGSRLPCIWKENCADQFISVDSKGNVAQCDCWVTSYPEFHFGNLFREPNLTRILSSNPVRRQFVQRPAHLVQHDDCLSCRFLAICHGGCPVRTYSASGTLLAKDPGCAVYKAVFRHAEMHGHHLMRRKTGIPAPSTLSFSARHEHDANHCTPSGIPLR